jgi:diacylglycerol kinase family enzyme
MTSVARSNVSSRQFNGRGIVLCNPASGPDDTAVDELRARFADHDVADCPPADLRRVVRGARTEGRPFVGIAGGDGSMRTAAEELAHADTALLPIPAGTHNHFARAFDIETVDDAAKAADPDGGEVRVIDLGRVNDRSFVNNSSVGFYPRLVQQREWHRHKLPKPLATALAALHQLFSGRRIVVQIDRRPVIAWLVFVGNGCYGEHVADLTSRDCLDDRVLDVRIVRADRRFARVRLLAALLLGRLARTTVVERRTCREITIDIRGRSRIDVALDGEIMQLSTPLRYESDAHALRVVVPK